MASTCSCHCATRSSRRPSAALVVATLALFLSLGGTSYAAVKAGSVGTKQLATNSVTASKIRTNAVGSSELVTGSVGASEIVAGAVRASELGTRSVTDAKIALDAVTSQVILDGSIGGQDIAEGSLGTQQVADGSLGTQDLAADVVARLLRAPAFVDAGGAATGQVLSTSPTLEESTEMRGHSVATADAGTVLVQGFADVGSVAGADVTCSLARTRGGVVTTLGSGVVTVPAAGRSVVPVQAVAALAKDDAVSLRCRASSAAAAGSASTLTLLRVGA